MEFLDIVKLREEGEKDENKAESLLLDGSIYWGLRRSVGLSVGIAKV